MFYNITLEEIGLPQREGEDSLRDSFSDPTLRNTGGKQVPQGTFVPPRGESESAPWRPCPGDGVRCWKLCGLLPLVLHLVPDSNQQ